MSYLLDSSVLVAAVVPSEPEHSVCRAILQGTDNCIYSQAIAETFSTLTGGRISQRIAPMAAAVTIEKIVAKLARVVSLLPGEMIAALHDSQRRGVRGGAIHDFLHLVAARKIHAERLYTLNLSDFRSFRHEGDPEILAP